MQKDEATGEEEKDDKSILGFKFRVISLSVYVYTCTVKQTNTHSLAGSPAASLTYVNYIVVRIRKCCKGVCWV